MEVYSFNVECKVSAKRMWLAHFADAHNFLPKAMPQSISRITYEGPVFRVGSFRTIHLHDSHCEQFIKETNHKHVESYVTDKLIEVDEKAFKIKSELVAGGLMGVQVKSLKQTTRFEEGATPNSCVVHWSFEYEALSKEHGAKIPPTLKKWIHGGFQEVEEYLLCHDDYKEA